MENLKGTFLLLFCLAMWNNTNKGAETRRTVAKLSLSGQIGAVEEKNRQVVFKTFQLQAQI